MWFRKRGRVAVGLMTLAAILVLGIALMARPKPVFAQMSSGSNEQVTPAPNSSAPEAPPPTDTNQPGRTQRRPIDMWRTSYPPMRSWGTASVAAYGDYVYVVQGNTLYQFSAKSLKLVNKTELPTIELMSQPSGPGQPGGFAPQPGPQKPGGFGPGPRWGTPENPLPAGPQPMGPGGPQPMEPGPWPPPDPTEW